MRIDLCAVDLTPCTPVVGWCGMVCVLCAMFTNPVEDTAGNSTILVKKGRRMDTARSSRRQYETSEGTVIEAEFHDK